MKRDEKRKSAGAEIEVDNMKRIESKAKKWSTTW